MKALKRSLELILIVLLASSPAIAKDEGRDGGGGDVRPASPAQIRAEILDVWNIDSDKSIKGAFFNLYLNYYNEKEITDPTIRKVLDKMFGTHKFFNPRPAILRAIELVRLDIKQNELCNYKGQSKASAVEKNEIDNSIFSTERHPGGSYFETLQNRTSISNTALVCFSLPAFSQIPYNGLRKTILALAAHEMTHIFGFGESEALKMEDFFLNNSGLITVDDVYSRAQQYAGDLSDVLEEVQESFDRNDSDVILCSKIGVLRGYKSQQWNSIFGIGGTIYKEKDRPFVIGRTAELLTHKVSEASASLAGYCGIEAHGNPYEEENWGKVYPTLTAGSKNALRARLKVLGTLVKSLKISVGVNN